MNLESGVLLEDVILQYERAGLCDGPVVLVCHALTGNHATTGTEDIPGWWSGLIGEGRSIDTTTYQVVTFNVLGGCDGSTGPTSINPKTGQRYRSDFPAITVRDMVHAQYKALRALGILKIHTVIGGSLGGMQVQEWALLYPEQIERAIILAATPTLSDYGIAYNHIARTAITSDPAWQNGFYQNNERLRGLEIARMVGMVSYRSAPLFAERFQRNHSGDDFEINAYLDYQGEKLCTRFDANSYLCLLAAMDQHDIGHTRGGWKKAAASFTVPMLAISFAHDLIYEPVQIKAFASHVPDCTYHHVETTFGHDGFLTEYEKWGDVVQQFVQKPLHEKVVQ
ncbi:homoserine O-acetyltransferase [Virgibacillus halophilus]